MSSVIKVCFYGPESTGKSTMAQKMAARYQTCFVPEVAREMITSNDFSVDDIIKIGQAQYDRTGQLTAQANQVLFSDTDLITTQIYAQHYLHFIPDLLFTLEKKLQFDAYFFFDIDTPWISDGLRDLGDQVQRQHMKEIFMQELEKRNIPFTMVHGTWEAKQQIIESALAKQWQIKPKD